MQRNLDLRHFPFMVGLGLGFVLGDSAKGETALLAVVAEEYAVASAALLNSIHRCGSNVTAMLLPVCYHGGRFGTLRFAVSMMSAGKSMDARPIDDNPPRPGPNRHQGRYIALPQMGRAVDAGPMGLICFLAVLDSLRRPWDSEFSTALPCAAIEYGLLCFEPCLVGSTALWDGVVKTTLAKSVAAAVLLVALPLTYPGTSAQDDAGNPPRKAVQSRPRGRGARRNDPGNVPRRALEVFRREVPGISAPREAPGAPPAVTGSSSYWECTDGETILTVDLRGNASYRKVPGWVPYPPDEGGAPGRPRAAARMKRGSSSGPDGWRRRGFPPSGWALSSRP